MTTDQIVARSIAVRDRLARSDRLAPWIDLKRGVPAPFVGTGDVRLIVLGQDPTVEVERSRDGIRTVLNLDRPGPLRTYIERIASGLGLSRENVYATNVCKHFFIERPTTIWAEQRVDVVKECASEVLPLLIDELQQFPDATVVTLGEPGLPTLVRAGSSLVRDYWGFAPDWKAGARNEFRMVSADASAVSRPFFPFPHQPSAGKEFYASRFGEFVAFVRSKSASA